MLEGNAGDAGDGDRVGDGAGDRRSCVVLFEVREKQQQWRR